MSAVSSLQSASSHVPVPEILDIGFYEKGRSEVNQAPLPEMAVVELQTIFSYLQGDEIAVSEKVCRLWKHSIDSSNRLWKDQCEHLDIPTTPLIGNVPLAYKQRYAQGFAFVAKTLYWARKWERDFPVKIHNPPPFPRNSYKFCTDPSLLPNKMAKDAEVFTLIPPISLGQFETLFKHPRRGEPIGFHQGSWADALQEHRQTPPETDKYFCAQMTKAPLEGSRYQDYAACERLVAERGGALGYEIGNIRVVSMCIFTEYFNSGTRLYNEEDWNFTWVKEKTGDWNLALGGFAHGAGPRFRIHISRTFGVGPLRKFS